MKAHLLHADRDFHWNADLPAWHQDLIQDLELTTLLKAMAAGATSCSRSRCGC